MVKPFLALLFLCAPGAAFAGPRPAPRCPDSSRPRFTGQPLAPFACSADAEAPTNGSGEVLVSTGIMPILKDGTKTSFEPLMGRWEGWAVYGVNRFEVLASVEKEKGRLVLKLSLRDYLVQSKNRFTAELKSSFWHAGRYSASVSALDLADKPLEALVWLGGTPAKDLNRSFVLAYEKLASAHEARFKLDGPDKIAYSYSYRRAGKAPVQFDGTLTRSSRDPF